MGRRLHLKERPTRPGRAPVEVLRPATPEVWSTALALAGGDVSRLEVLPPDGWVLVRNQPQRRAGR